MFVVVKNSNFSKDGYKFPFPGYALGIFKTKEECQITIDKDVIENLQIDNTTLTYLKLKDDELLKDYFKGVVYDVFEFNVE